MNTKQREALIDPLISNNPISLQVLGICSALAVTTKVETSLVMSIAVIAVLTLSNLSISLMRNLIPSQYSNYCAADRHRVAGHSDRPDFEGVYV